MKLSVTVTKFVSSALIAALASYFGKVSIPVIVLVIMMILDYFTGLASAWVRGVMSSRTGIVGIVKKVCYLALVAIGCGCDWVISEGLAYAGYELEMSSAVCLLIAVWLIINEMISVLENLTELQIPVPSFLSAIIKKLKVYTENNTKEDK